MVASEIAPGLVALIVGFQSPSLRGSGRFFFGCCCPIYFVVISIPFIAGQWSLQAEVIGAADAALEFQSPSLRGSGRFKELLAPYRRRGGNFNPLHCGAVVASSKLL